MTWTIPPREWWLSPASLTGQHHPPGQTQLSHALSVYRAARWAWRRVPWAAVRCNPRRRRSFLLAALYHDIGKHVDRDRHEMAGADMMVARDPVAAYLILHHSGRWGPSYSQRIGYMVDTWISDTVRMIDYDDERMRWLGDLLGSVDYADAHRHIMFPAH